MEQKTLKAWFGLGAALLGVWFALTHVSNALVFLKKLLGILSPFLLGAALAFVLNVPMRFLENKVFRRMERVKWLAKAKRPIALSVTLLLAALVVYLVMSMVIPEITTTLETLIKAIPSFVRQVETLLANYDFEPIEFLRSRIHLPTGADLEAQLGNMLNIAIKGVAFSGSVIGSVYSNILDGFFVCMFVIYFLLGKERLAKQAQRLLYAFLKRNVVDEILRVTSLIQCTFSSFITGQCLEAIILGCMFFFAMSLFGMPYALLISVFIAVTALIPVVGAWIGCFVGAFLILVSNPMQALGFLALFLVVQQLEGNIVYPRVMGNAIGLPSIWVLFAVVLGEGLMGILGMLLFIPLVSVCYKLLSEVVEKRLKARAADPLHGGEE